MKHDLIRHICSLEIPKYIRIVKTAEAKRPKYYSNKSGPGRVNKLPVRLEKSGEYTIDAKGFYLNKQGEKIVANTRTVGKPNTFNINGQILYVGKPWQRAAMKATLAEFFTPLIEELPKFEGSIITECDIYTTIGHKQADLDNLGYIYGKVLMDTIVNNGKLEDDCVPYVTKPPTAPLFHPVSNDEERRLVYHFYQDLRPEIIHLNE